MWSRTVAVLLFCVGVDLSAVSQHETIFLDVDAYQPVPSPDGKLVRLLAVPASKSVRDKRDHAILSLLLGCGLRRAELTGLTLGHLQQRDEHWAIVNLYGKGGHIRTVPVPFWVKTALDQWLIAAAISEGGIFRRVSRSGKVWGPRISEKLVWWIVRQRAQVAGIERLAPHDLRRTCARLCHAAGGELEQIQFLLGHRSVETTERYLGSRRRLVSAANDKIGLEPDFGP